MIKAKQKGDTSFDIRSTVSNKDDRKGPQGNVRKPNEALKPAKLLRDNTPVEFTIWVEQFAAYHSSSRMELCSIPEQQAYFKACLEPALIARIASKITPTLPVVPPITPLGGRKNQRDGTGSVASGAEPEDEPDCCIEILHREFVNQYPIFTRRLDFFRSQQGQNQNFSDWTQALRRKGDECDLDSINASDIFILRYLTGIADKKLMAELLKLKDPTVKDLDEAVINWEVSQRCMKKIDSAANKASSFATVAGKGQQNSKNKGNNSHKNSKSSNAKTGSKNNTNKVYKCYRCGSPNTDHQCKALSATCSFCKKAGHFASVCNAKAKGKPAANSAAAQPTPNVKGQGQASTNAAEVC